jgi:hypothetical protein
MEIRLGDLYELIVRIVDDRLKQRGETEHIAAMKGSESSVRTPSKVAQRTAIAISIPAGTDSHLD